MFLFLFLVLLLNLLFRYLDLFQPWRACGYHGALWLRQDHISGPVGRETQTGHFSSEGKGGWGGGAHETEEGESVDGGGIPPFSLYSEQIVSFLAEMAVEKQVHCSCIKILYQPLVLGWVGMRAE